MAAQAVSAAVLVPSHSQTSPPALPTPACEGGAASLEARWPPDGLPEQPPGAPGRPRAPRRPALAPKRQLERSQNSRDLRDGAFWAGGNREDRVHGETGPEAANEDLSIYLSGRLRLLPISQGR